MRPLLSGFLPVLALLFAASHCNSSVGSCTLIGCLSEVTASRAVPVALSELDGASVIICFNDDCATGTLELSGADDELALCEFEDSFRRSCAAERLGDSEVRLEMAFTLGDADAPHDGDQYSFGVHPADDPDVALVEISGAVLYEKLRPNGEGCEPTCRVKSL